MSSSGNKMETDGDGEAKDDIPEAVAPVPQSADGEIKEKISCKVDMDEAMEKLEIPYKKVMEMDCAYLLAISSKQQIEEAVLKLQSLTKVTWSVKQTRKFVPCIKKNPKKPATLFKRQYGCYMSTRTRTTTKKLRNKRSRNINCPAQLLVSIRNYFSSEKVRKKPISFDQDFPCLFEFRHDHNHLVDVVDVLNTRPMGDDIKNAIVNLFSKGHSCSSGYHTLYALKVEEFGDEYKIKMADRHHFPRRNDLASLFKAHGFRQKYDSFQDLPRTIKNLEEILSGYQKTNNTLYKMLVQNDMIVICLCTPLMQRTIQQASDVLLIDSSANEFKEYKVYFLLTQSDVGVLPISCILSNKHDMSAFREGMRLFLEMVDIQAAVVLTDSSIMKELVSQLLFPRAKILLSFYHVLNSAWRALYETRHELARTKKESYYQLFREVVFAHNEEGLVVARQVLAVECAHPKFLAYIDKMYENIHLWCLYYREFVEHDSQTYDYTEAELSFRLFRLISKVVLEKTRLFNINQITDFMCSAFEKYYKSRIVEMVMGKKSKVLGEKYGWSSSNNELHYEDIGHHEYVFTKEILNEYYQVDMITNLCSCGLGAVGKHCEHVAKILEKENVFCPTLSEEQKVIYYFVATGILKHKDSFLPENCDNLMDEEDESCSTNGIREVRKGLHIVKSDPDLKAIKTKWVSYCNNMLNLMERDPAKFIPAIDAHLNNIKRHSASVPLLLKGLYTGFPSVEISNQPPPLTMISTSSRPTTERMSSNNCQIKKPACNSGPSSILAVPKIGSSEQEVYVL